jgi:hypothetical protein
MNYEQGLERLKQLLPDNTDLYDEFLAYEQQLQDILHSERVYGSNEQKRSERAQIIAQLNRLARQVGPKSFNDLCRPENISNLQTSSKPTSTISAKAQPQPANIKPSSQRTKAYISFSTQDNASLNELHTALNQFTRQGLNYWDRSKMLPGVNQIDTITTALNTTKVAILLVSSDFLAADSPDFIADLELPTLLKAAKNNEVTLFPIIVRPCAIEYSDLKSFNPFNSRPLSSLSNRHEREEIWQQVAIQTLNLLR